MSLTLSSDAPMEWSTRFVRWWQSCGRDLVGCRVVTRVCGRGELAVAPACRRGLLEKKRGEGMGKTDRGSGFCLQRPARAMSWLPTRTWAATLWPDSGIGRPRRHSECLNQSSMNTTDNQTLTLQISPNQAESVKTIHIKVVEECEIYKFVNRSLSWFGMVYELHGSKVGYIKTVFQLRLSQKCLVTKQPSHWLVGHFWECSGHFHEMVILELLFPIKFSTTLVDGAPPCKISKIYFLNGQTKALLKSPHGQHT
jgi:hypothetical protein